MCIPRVAFFLAFFLDTPLELGKFIQCDGFFLVQNLAK